MAQVAAAAVAVATSPPPSPVQANATTLTTPADIDTKMVKIMMKMMNKMTTTGNLGGGNPAGGKTTNKWRRSHQPRDKDKDVNQTN